MLRKFICLIVTVALVVCVSVAPAGAVDLDAYFNAVVHSTGYADVTYTFPIPRYGNKSSLGIFRTYAGTSGSWVYFSNMDLSYPQDSPYVSGTVGAYFSYAFGTSSDGQWSSTVASDCYDASFSLGNTSSFIVPATVESFNFSSGVVGEKLSPGVSLSARLSDVDALTAFSFISNGPPCGVVFSTPAGGAPEFSVYVPSVSVVFTQTSADLDALESVADEIAAGNDIARAMYGDIMEALNSISGDTELMASYINDCLTSLNAIDNKTLNIYNLCASYLHNLADIAQTAEDIEAELEAFHTDFMSKLDVLISTIISESDDIQATMDRIYEQLIAWLESNFTEAINPELDGTNEDLSQGIANSEAIEQEWTGSLSDNWSAMHIDDFSFDSSFTSGFMWVSAWVTNIYNALGLYGSIIILPLIIGICKLLLGYFRFSGHGHSSGGDDVDA